MVKMSIKQLLNSFDLSGRIRIPYNFINRFHLSKKSDNVDEFKWKKNDYDNDSGMSKCSSKTQKNDNNKWKPDIDWLGKAVEPAFQLYKWALPTGNGNENKPPPTDRSLREIYACIQRSKLGIQGWSLSDLTIGLYLIYLRQASSNALEDVNGELISSDSIVHELIYHMELAKGAYKHNAASLARNSMLQEYNIVKFIGNSSLLRPGYYIGIDKQRKLVILCIRGTHNVYDLITDIVSSSHEDITFQGYSTHFGTYEAARWLLIHEIDAIRKCLQNHKGFRLRLVGHSLGGATASLLAIMLRKKSIKELGFDPDIISAIGYGTPPCVSKELAESCFDFVTTVVMQGDIVPRLSIASITRLRNEIVETDWDSVFKREDWKVVIDVVTNAKQVVSSVQDVARKLANYAKFLRRTKYSAAIPKKEDISVAPSSNQTSNPSGKSSDVVRHTNSVYNVPEDLFIPGTVYYLKRNVDAESHDEPREYFTLLRRQPGEHFRRVLLSSNIISDHKCDSHHYALRDVLKGLSCSSNDNNF